jgi:hypothetical protein
MLGVSVKSLFWFRESLSSCYSLSSPVFMKEFRKKFPVNFFSLNLDKLIWKLKILLNSSNSLLKTTLQAVSSVTHFHFFRPTETLSTWGFPCAHLCSPPLHPLSLLLPQLAFALLTTDVPIL